MPKQIDNVAADPDWMAFGGPGRCTHIQHVLDNPLTSKMRRQVHPTIKRGNKASIAGTDRRGSHDFVLVSALEPHACRRSHGALPHPHPDTAKLTLVRDLRHAAVGRRMLGYTLVRPPYFGSPPPPDAPPSGASRNFFFVRPPVGGRGVGLGQEG